MLTPSQQSFLTTAALASVQSEATWGVPAELTLPQAIFESGWGASTIDNNCLGIKANGRGCGTVLVATKEYVNGKPVVFNLAFEKYATLEACFADHGWLISHGAPYASVWSRYNATKGTPGALAALILGIGHVYSTSPSYGQDILTFSQSATITDALRIARSSATLIG